jgi:hypothetical protein
VNCTSFEVDGPLCTVVSAIPCEAAVDSATFFSCSMRRYAAQQNVVFVQTFARACASFECFLLHECAVAPATEVIYM